MQRRQALVLIVVPCQSQHTGVGCVRQDRLRFLPGEIQPLCLGKMPALDLGGQTLIPLSVGEGEGLGGGRRLARPRVSEETGVAWCKG